MRRIGSELGVSASTISREIRAHQIRVWRAHHDEARVAHHRALEAPWVRFESQQGESEHAQEVQSSSYGTVQCAWSMTDRPSKAARERNRSLLSYPKSASAWRRTRIWCNRYGPTEPTTCPEGSLEEENRRLRRELAESRRANEILKAASVFFAKELDHPTTK